MRKNNVLLLLALLKMVSLTKGAVADYYESYDIKYDEDDLEEDEEETINMFEPTMVSNSTDIVVDAGTTIRLPCQVDELPDDLVSLWSKVDPSNPTNYLAVGRSVISQDSRVTVEVSNTGSYLIIALASKEDEGVYNCTIASSGMAPSVAHTVRLQDPEKSKSLAGYRKNQVKKFLEASIGDDVTLTCNGKGNPPPQIFWTKVGSLFSDGSDSIEQSTITLQKVLPGHAGIYQCTGTNGRGPSATDQLSLYVLHKPAVKVERVFMEKEDRRALELVCRVEGWPPPKVEWIMEGNNTTKLDSNVVEEGGVVHHKIYLEEVAEEDYGKYKCQARNSLGNASKTLEVSKLASEAHFHSSSEGTEKTTFLLEWSVYSFTPVTHFFLQIWRKDAWKKVEVPAKESGTYHYAGQYYMELLEGGTMYKAKVAAVNEIGRSKNSPIFDFYTKGAGPRQAEIISGAKRKHHQRLPFLFIFLFPLLQSYQL